MLRGFEGGMVIGGMKEVDDWGVEFRLEIREKLLEMFKGMCFWILNGKGEFIVMGDIVG